MSVYSEYIDEKIASGCIPMETEADLIALDLLRYEPTNEVRFMVEVWDDLFRCVEARGDAPEGVRCRWCSTLGQPTGLLEKDPTHGQRMRPQVTPFWDFQQQCWEEEMTAYGVTWDPTITF